MTHPLEQVPGNGSDPSAWSVPSDDGHSTVHCTLNRGPNLATAGEETADFRGDSGTKQRCAGETDRGRLAIPLLLTCIRTVPKRIQVELQSCVSAVLRVVPHER